MISETFISIDPKRRISIPTKYRKMLGRVLVLQRGLDGNIDVYTKESWEKEETKKHILNNKLPLNKEGRLISRHLMSVYYADVDSSGRILIPEQLASYADLKAEAVLLGNNEGIEIWSKEKYQSEVIDNIGNVSKALEDPKFSNLNE